MSALAIGASSLVLMVGLIYAGLHVAVALALCSFLGVWAIKGSWVLAGKLLALAAADSISSDIFGVIPLFVLMGLVVGTAGLGKDAFDVANHAFRRVKGGLGVATVGANAVFAAITGISIASAAVFTKVAVPEMLRHGYRPRFAVGVVAGSSVLGMLIPPSLLLILYGVLTEQSIGALFMAGVVPGLVLAVAFAVAIVAMARWCPDYVGRDVSPPAPSDPSSGAGETATKLAPIVLLVALVLGGIYGGVLTPNEAGAAGAGGAIVLAVAKRRLGLREFWAVVVETGHITASICFLIIAATMYARMLSLSGLSHAVGAWIGGLDVGLNGVIVLYVAIILLLGMVLDSSSILLVMVPLILPVVKGYGVDLIWFGIVTVLAVEIGLLTPPLGLSVFTIHNTLDDPDITLDDIFAGALPFAGIMLLVLVVIILVPSLSTCLI